MKNFFSRPTTFVAAAAIAFSFTACEQSDISPDADFSAQNAQAAHQSKSFNLNKVYTVNLNELNNSGVSGTATLTLMGDKLEVHIQASGLEPNKLHPQHIHGFVENNRNATCPDMSSDMDGDGLIELAEGLPSYGPVLLSLTPFPTAPDGTIDYKQTFDMTADLRPLQNRVIVLHGMTVDGEYLATLPVACGMVMNANNGKKK
ncbi:CHRD domain-containing protein [Pontibacter akesuensis]|uniref:Uncharacterized protein n=1 Tax=Pontibacter akesuensis TaxID=388950 RepID=A0A1I7KX23_9BACT|nr:CHRD domain-containing protein [Pontibacter akesuensis]GHA78590.1 hypothetical protein GCM10007389_35990 [Pontibacter akesuensis]SFV02052.1 hypothetical protein SAMN04487941_0068 [Pontibacter akesuensis]